LLLPVVWQGRSAGPVSTIQFTPQSYGHVMVPILRMKAEWDIAKASENLRKHSVSFPEAIEIFEDPFALTLSDTEHSVDEDRYVTLGLCKRLDILLVVHTYRLVPPHEVLRIISARKATQNERNMYIRRREGKN
jgi:uncharacterized DUF497 family protein